MREEPQIKFRQVTEADAEAYLKLRRRLDRETEFMLLQPDERVTTLEQERNRLVSLLEQGTSMIFAAEAEGRWIGYLGAFGSNYKRNKHTVSLVLGILQSYSGRGVGTRLFAELNDWAAERGIHRLELTVMAHNEVAIALYKKCGFEVEGIRKHAIRLGDRYIDEFYMAKLLPL
ncbi:N-acetyltransferase [Paenibacillus faecis]|uniref:GNAT family N-acetyltransferase n=1 Tax=Paenibacillus faecis TaxID=862114 RepID=UPI001B13E840|nr:GNAT family protein [Paenibacillus faecis]GIO86640.1 N-acetyltransferase [Paenibacillus faecis]